MGLNSRHRGTTEPLLCPELLFQVSDHVDTCVVRTPRSFAPRTFQFCSANIFPTLLITEQNSSHHSYLHVYPSHVRETVRVHEHHHTVMQTCWIVAAGCCPSAGLQLKVPLQQQSSCLIKHVSITCWVKQSSCLASRLARLWQGE